MNAVYLIEKYGNFDFIQSCFHLSIMTATCLVIVEAISWTKEWAAKFKKRDDIRELYMEAVQTNAFHYIVIGPVAYAIAVILAMEQGAPSPDYIAIPGVILVQGIGYALAHNFMHQPNNYWIHKYHHRYNEKTFVRPIAANSTTVTEFLLAYALPIVTGIILFRPRFAIVNYIVMAVSLTNLAIHTPETIFPMGWAPSWLVTNVKHFHHHEKDLRKHYSAPIFDFDSLLFGSSSSTAASTKSE